MTKPEPKKNVEAVKKPNYFENWYSKHKGELAAKRKKRYEEDPVYRAKALANRANQLRSNRETEPLGEEYTTTFAEAAEDLNISIWRFRHWRGKNYFPEPHLHGKFLYFTDNQMSLLQGLADFMEQYPRLPAKAKEPLAELVGLIYANWS